MREASLATQLEDRAPPPLMHVFALTVADRPAFEAAIAASPIAGATWYRSLGAGPGDYLLMAPASAAGTVPRLAQVLGADHLALAHAHATRAEAWRYAPRLSLFPGEPLAR